MIKLEIFDPPMCCETGVCGAEIDPVLPRFAADLEWLKSRGCEVKRFNLAQEPAEFVSRSAVSDALAAEGNACLPLILVDGQIAKCGDYPAREELASLAGMAGEEEGNANAVQISRKSLSIPVFQTQSCCEPGDGESSCC